MNCVIPGPNLKILSKAIQALAKVGDELSLEAHNDHLSLRSSNMTTTAYCACNFFDIFFTTYEVANPADPSTSEALTCKIPMKAVVSVFKSHGHKDKKIEFCKIELGYDADKIVFKFQYKHDVMVRRMLYLINGVLVNVVYKKEYLVNHASDDDVTVEVASDKALIRNYIPGDVSLMKGIRSQLTLTAGEFNTFKIEQEVSVTFLLRPLRAAIHFAETFGLTVALDFGKCGKPLVIAIKSPTFEITFIIATLSDNSSTQSTLSSAALTRSKLKGVDKHNMTIQDKQVLETINWDNDFDAQSERMDVHSNDNPQNGGLIKDKRPKLSADKKADSDEDVVSNSPENSQNKRIKTIFGRCYDATFHPSMVDLGKMLAPDSDPDSE